MVKKIGKVYRVTLIANKCDDGTISIDVYDGSEVDWREITDCATYDVREIEIPVSGSVDLTRTNNTNSITTISNTRTDTTMMKAGWYSDNFRTYYLDENGVKHYY